MAVFIELVTDGFQDTFNKQRNAAAGALGSSGAGAVSARRPSRGLEVKDDTYAILKVVTSDGTPVPLVDGGSPSGTSTSYTNFILQSVTEARMEKNQIVETFGDSYIFFFGEAPRFLDVSVILVNSNDFNWEAEFWDNYDNYFRGTKSVEMGARTYMFYDDNIVEGYMLQAQAVKTSDLPLMVRLQYRLFVTNSQNISFVGDPNFPVRPSVILPAGVTNVDTALDQNLNATLAANLQAAGFGGAQDLISALQQGADPGQISPTLQGIISNTVETFGGVDGFMPSGFTRGNPIRSLIHDNTDEYTGTLPPIDGGEIDGGQDPNLEVQDLHNQSMQSLQNTGVNVFDPYLMNNLGMGPSFNRSGVGIGLGATVGVGATFGASFSAGAGASAGVGLGGGLGFSGRQLGGIGYGSNTGFVSRQGTRTGVYSDPLNTNYIAQGTLQDQQNAGSYLDILDYNFNNALGPSQTYYGGTQVSGGISSGTGLGGGVYGGLPPTVLFVDQPQPSGFVGGTGNGANLNVGGNISAFAMVSADGFLSPDGFDVQGSSYLQ